MGKKESEEEKFSAQKVNSRLSLVVRKEAQQQKSESPTMYNTKGNAKKLFRRIQVILNGSSEPGSRTPRNRGLSSVNLRGGYVTDTPVRTELYTISLLNLIKPNDK